MTAKKRSGLMSRAVGTNPRNTVSNRVDGMTQASKIKNTVGGPASVGVSQIRNTVNSPNQS